MNTNELWLLGVNDEYCWNSDHHGSWDCIECRVAITLPAFFAALAHYATLRYWGVLA